MRNSAGPDDAPDTAPDQHARPRHVAPLRTANDRTARLGLERPPTTADFHTRPLGLRCRPFPQVAGNGTGRVAQLRFLLVVLGEPAEQDDRLTLRRAVPKADDRETPHCLIRVHGHH